MLDQEIKSYAEQFLENEKENFLSLKNYTLQDYIRDIDVYYKLDLENLSLYLEQYHWVDYDGLKLEYARFLVKTYIMVVSNNIVDKSKILRLYYSQYLWHKKNNPLNFKKEFILL